MRTGNLHVAGAKLVPKSMTPTEMAALTNVEIGTIVYNSFYGVTQMWNGDSWTTYVVGVVNGSGISVGNPSPGYYTVALNETIEAGTGIQSNIAGGVKQLSTKLVAGTGIGITYPTSGTNAGSAYISNTAAGATYTAGTGISLSGTQINCTVVDHTTTVNSSAEGIVVVPTTSGTTTDYKLYQSPIVSNDVLNMATIELTGTTANSYELQMNCRCYYVVYRGENIGQYKVNMGTWYTHRGDFQITNAMAAVTSDQLLFPNLEVSYFGRVMDSYHQIEPNPQAVSIPPGKTCLFLYSKLKNTATGDLDEIWTPYLSCN